MTPETPTPVSSGAERIDKSGEALARVIKRWRDGNAARNSALETMSPPAFRAIVAERLRNLERELVEVRSRVNGLMFVVAGAVITQVVLRLFG
jgi:hypothetical protein